MATHQPIRIALTPEQQETIRRLSGEHVEAIELTPENLSGGGPLRISWRLSIATGIPRQAWSEDSDTPPAKSK